MRSGQRIDLAAERDSSMRGWGPGPIAQASHGRQAVRAHRACRPPTRLRQPTRPAPCEPLSARRLGRDAVARRREASRYPTDYGGLPLSTHDEPMRTTTAIDESKLESFIHKGGSGP